MTTFGSVGSFSGLNTALRGVLAQQRSLDVTGHNIANVDTIGYSRQEAVLAAASALNVVGGQIGQGVNVSEYRRLRNEFLDLQWRTQNTSLGNSGTQSSKMQAIESAFNDTSEAGLGKQLSEFYSAWSDLAANPESTSARTALYGKTQTLMSTLHALDQTLTNVDNQVTNEISTLLAPNGEIDKIAQEINTLNVKINHSLLSGESPNDLLDRRDQLLDNLSSYGTVSINVPDTSRPGFVQVTFADQATPLVDTASGTPVTLPTPAALTTPGGRLGGLIAAGDAIDDYRTMLDGLASQLVTQVNGQHGTPAFFDGTGTTAATIAFGSGLTGPSTIVAGTGAAGDNSIALAIAGQRSSTGANPTTSWTSLLSRIGTDISAADSKTKTSSQVLSSLTSQRSATSGVSLDEEMANMLRFQRGYQAAARALTAMDQNLEILINRTGRVGL